MQEMTGDHLQDGRNKGLDGRLERIEIAGKKEGECLGKGGEEDG